MNIYTELLLVTAIVVYVVDLSGFINSLKDALGKMLGGKVTRLKPLDCSLCMTWWMCLIYALVVGQIDLLIIAYCALLSLMAIPIGQIIILIREFINYIIIKLMSRL